MRVLHYSCGVPGYMVAENQLANLGTPKLVILPSPMALPDATWNRLLDYVSNGGTLLVTGSMERDPAWVPTSRLKAIGVDAGLANLNFRTGSITIRNQTITVSFSDQSFLDMLRFADGSTYKEVQHGRGRLILTSYPVELSEGNDPTAAVYRAALTAAGLTSPYVAARTSSAVLIRPTFFADSILYLFSSEGGDDQDIDITDTATRARIQFRLSAGRASLVLLNRKDGKIIGRYGF